MAATATASQQHSPAVGSNTMSANSSPRISRNQNSSAGVKQENDNTKEDPAPEVKPSEDSKADNTATSKEPENPPTTNAPLAPPPKPNQNGEDYFSAQHSASHLTREPNPFESAFSGGGNPSEGKSQLPGIAQLTSPASLLPGGGTPGWPGSLRSGPLSPAMLTGPTGSSDYFNSDHHFAGSFPTPNESSLRTGLTPGGGGSMFPQPSPNSQALFSQLQSGGATPGTIDFHRTAMTARAHSQAGGYNLTQNGQTSQPQQNPNIQPDLDSKPYQSNTSQPQQQAPQQSQQSQQQQQHQQQQHQHQHQENNQDPFSSHQTNDAANGLFMLAQAGGQQQQQRNGQQGYGVQPQHQQQYQQNMQQQQQHGTSPDMNNRGPKGSVGSTMSGSTENGQGEYSDGSVDVKPSARGGRGGKKGSAGKGPANGKRKNEETPSRAQNNNKRQRGANGQSMQGSEEPEDMASPEMEENGPDGRKMTDEEKRKNFLERNRVAALKCRQRKKQWLANLQQKVEIFSTENDALAATVTQLREEIVGLKTLLLAHKDCPVSVQQGISGMAMQQIAGQDHYNTHPYGMGLPGGPGNMQQNQMQQGGMQRR